LAEERQHTYGSLLALALTSQQRGNLERNIAEFEEARADMESLPPSMSVDLWNACDLRCRLCETRFDLRANNASFVDELFDCYAQLLCNLQISGGEPLLHPRFLDYLGRPGQAPALLGITTSGVHLHDRVIDQLLDFSEVQLHISLDSFDAEVFEQLRCGATLETVVGAVRRAVRGKNAAQCRPRSRRWYIALNVVVSAWNIRELPLLLENAAALGADGVHFCRIAGDFPTLDFFRYPDLLPCDEALDIAEILRKTMSRLPTLAVEGGDLLANEIEKLGRRATP
jgi:hypothetical protein